MFRRFKLLIKRLPEVFSFRVKSISVISKVGGAVTSSQPHYRRNPRFASDLKKIHFFEIQSGSISGLFSAASSPEP
ncbi:hypothetical protein DsansV1_C01g0012561 [Dioscorea sansibarensis]